MSFRIESHHTHVILGAEHFQPNNRNGVFIRADHRLDPITAGSRAAYTEVPTREPFWKFWRIFHRTSTITVCFAPSLFSDPLELALKVAHEGMHVADGAAWLGAGKPQNYMTRYITELRAFTIENDIFGGSWYSNFEVFYNNYIPGYFHIINLRYFDGPPEFFYPIYTWMPGWDLTQQQDNINIVLQYSGYGIGPGAQGGDAFPSN
jgi:hypothetical protein